MNIPADKIALIEMLNALSDKERLELFSNFCRDCGISLENGACYCWNDE